METIEMITPDSCPSGLVLPESGSVELMPEKAWVFRSDVSFFLVMFRSDVAR
jgi:hypothetical protein